MTDTTATATYTPEFFDVASLQEAKNVILGPEDGGTVEQRWWRETPYLIGLIQQHISIDEKTVLLDYGCGVGRLSRELIKRAGCKSIGVDFSVNMRALAANYVASPKFYSCDAVMLQPECADVALSVWVLQHCTDPAENIRQIYEALKPGGKFFVLDELRLIPTNRGWVRDQKNVFDELTKRFEMVCEIKPLSEEKLTRDLASRTRCAIWSK